MFGIANNKFGMFGAIVGSIIIFSVVAISAILNVLSLEDNVANSKSIAGSSTDKAVLKPLSFAVYTLADDDQSLDVLKEHYLSLSIASGNGTNSMYDDTATQSGYVMDGIGSILKSSSLFEAFPDQKKMIIVPSLNNLTKAVELGDQFNNVQVITYDLEHWSRTPHVEKSNPVASISKGSTIVHEMGFDYGITPDARFLLENYRAINWKEVDFLGMQLQRFSANITEFSSYVKDISSYVRSINPEIEVYAQVSFRFTSVSDMVRAIEATKDVVDGYIVVYLPDTIGEYFRNSCINSCTPADLDDVLTTISVLRSERQH